MANWAKKYRVGCDPAFRGAADSCCSTHPYLRDARKRWKKFDKTSTVPPHRIYTLFEGRYIRVR